MRSRLERDLTLARRALDDGALGYLFKDSAHLELISPRETELLRLMALGHTNREIGEQLDHSIRTVETHRAHIQQKLGLSTRPELTRYALDNRLIGD